MAQSDASEAVVIICDGRTFIAGADITEFDKPFMEPGLPDVLNTIEASKKLVIAAMHGTALGGGFETALAAHYRCSVPSAKIGLPEVKLGLLPGAGGTQRTPRLAGVKAALDLFISGAPIRAADAQNIGLIDKIIEGDLCTGALAWANELIESDAPVRRKVLRRRDDHRNLRDRRRRARNVLSSFYDQGRPALRVQRARHREFSRIAGDDTGLRAPIRNR